MTTKTEVKILTDLEMTNLISHSKHGKAHKDSWHDDWLYFTEVQFDACNGDRHKFLNDVNSYLHKNKIQIEVVDFIYEPEIGGIQWTIKVPTFEVIIP